MREKLESTSLAERIVLCCLVNLAKSGETPANSAELREVASDSLEKSGGEHVGRLAEADVMRALNELSERTLIEEHRSDDSSPVGKGRPEYDLGVAADRLGEELANDPRVAPLLES